MALISCPKCGNRYSNQLSACPQCHLDPVTDDVERLKKTALRAFRTRIYHLKMLSYVGLTLLTAGIIWYWVASSRLTIDPGIGPWVIIGMGTLVYLLIRALMIMAKLNYRKQWKR